MAKSLRSKTKRTFRNKKREDGIYAATEAARLHRLNAKLVATTSKDPEGDVVPSVEGGEDEIPVDNNDTANDSTGWIYLFQPPASDLKHYPDSMAVDAAPKERISTHGPRGSRREEWRLSKGLDPKPKRDAMNRQGGLAGRRKSGRSKRRR